ncbi:uncharacterized protein LOC126617213 [Malus sylvestris]|uniref:uncharacterized protein LOC126617213 n=1 Tax=Malus sylvestris TaxID=3752 RepID=UPI0021AC3699|nr:uncharacterized protein LOC126617213 [Malus sylvestris]
MKKKVHPSSQKRNTLYDVVTSSSTHPKKLGRRLPHLFASVLELPFHSNADVSIQKTSDSFIFSVSMPTHVPSPATQRITGDHVAVRAHTIEIYPGVTKTVIRKTDGSDLWWLDGGVVDDLDLWRYRLPASTRPELARTTCTGEKLVVTVPTKRRFWVKKMGG